MQNEPIIHEAWPAALGVSNVTELFRETFGEDPAGVWSAPGRVNLIGEHTDYNGGLSLPIALPHRTYAAVKPRGDRTVRLVSAQEDSVRTVQLDEVGLVGTDNEVEGWPAYIAGVAWAMGLSGEEVSGFDIAIDSCVPYGAGLSSSAALSGSAAIALNDIFGLEARPSQLVKWCISAENDVAGAPTGGMDQSASLRSNDGHAILLDSRDGSIEHVEFNLDQAGLELLVIDTKAPHALVDGQYAQRRQTCEDAAAQLGVEYLADITDPQAALDQLSDPLARQRVRHVVTEIARTQQVAEILKASPLAEETARRVGELFTQSHVSLQNDYEVSCPELDAAVGASLTAGAYGARMTGGGFGGSAIALVPKDLVQEVMGAVNRRFAADGFAPPEFLEVQPGPAASRDA